MTMWGDVLRRIRRANVLIITSDDLKPNEYSFRDMELYVDSTDNVIRAYLYLMRPPTGVMITVEATFSQIDRLIVTNDTAELWIRTYDGG